MRLKPILRTKLQAKEHCLQLQIWSSHVFPWSGSFNAIFIFTMDAIELCKRTPARMTCQGSVVDLQFQREQLWQTVFCYSWRLVGQKPKKQTHNIVLNKKCFQMHCQLYHSNKMISDSDVPSFFFCVTFLTKEVPRIFLLTKAPVKLHKKVCCFGVNKSQHDYHFVKRIVQTKKSKFCHYSGYSTSCHFTLIWLSFSLEHRKKKIFWGM